MLWGICDLTSKNDRGLSALKRAQYLWWDYSLSALTHVHAVNVSLKDTSVALGSNHDGAEFLIGQKKYQANKSKLGAPHKASGSKLLDALPRL